jgi:predicted ribosomally synthesized peptide with nif11-like leader
MSKSQLHAFIDRARVDKAFRNQFSQLETPEQILECISKNGFIFSDEIKGRFINRWKGVYFCPQAIEVGEICPGLVPKGFKDLIHYAQSTCSSSTLKEEEHDFRSGKKY